MVTINESRTACKYTPGRQGRRVDKIVIHHWGVDGQTHDGVVDWFCNPAQGARTSAHFVVSAGKVHCIVSPADTAWHAGDWDANLTSIGIECRPEATVADYATVAWLVRWLRARYGNLPLLPHKAFTSTSCPGRWDLARLDREARGGGSPATGGGGAVSGAMRPVPAMYAITQRYADNATIYNYGAGHGAIDYGVPVGTPIVALEDGVVTHADWAWNLAGGPGDWVARDYQIKPAPGDTRTGGGIMVRLVNSIGSRWWVCHLSRTDLNPGDRVRRGQIIGYSGNTGSSTGPHTHVALLPPSPAWGNGYYGSIDPEPYIKVPYQPLTYTAWQGAPTTGKGGATTRKDWFDMATEADLRRIVREEIRAQVQHAQFKDINGKVQTLNQVWSFRTRKTEGLLGAIAAAVKPSTIALALWGYKSKAINGAADAYKLLTDTHRATTASGSTPVETKEN